MAGRRNWLRVTVVLAITLSVLALCAWYAWGRFLDAQGISHLEWQGLHPSFGGLALTHLELERQDAQGSRLRLEAEGIALDWSRDEGLHLERLDVRRLALDWQPSSAVATTTSAPFDSQSLDWLPRYTRIDELTAELPCAQGRCMLQGALALTHAGPRLLPARLEAELQRTPEQRLRVSINLEGTPDSPSLDVRLLVGEAERLSLRSVLESGAEGRTWSGQLLLPALPEAPWLLEWLNEWVALPKKDLPAPPDALRLAADWQLRLPDGPLAPALLIDAEGQANLSAHLLVPWPLPGVGQIQGDLSATVHAGERRWYPDNLDADLQLSALSGDWLAAIPEALRPETLRLQARSAAASDADALLPLDIDLRTNGPLVLTAKGALNLATRPPWQVQFDSTRIGAKVTRLSFDGIELRSLQTELLVSGQIDGQQLKLTLGESSRIAVGSVAEPNLRLERLDGELAGLRVEGDFSAQPLTWHIQGPLRLKAQRLEQEYLHAQGWQWQGEIDASQAGQRLEGVLLNDRGLSLNLTGRQASGAPLVLDAELPEIFLRAGNPLAKTLADWPALLDLNSGRLSARTKLRLPGGSAPEADLNLTLKGLAGIYDRTEISGLDGSLRLQVRQQRLHIDIPELNLRQANPGVPIGPLRGQGHYVAALAKPLEGKLDWQRAETGFLGGRVWLEPGSLDLAQPGARLPLKLQGLQLEQLFKAYPAEDLAGTGTLDGQLPLLIGPDGIRIEQGSLAAREPGGRLQLRSERIKALGRSNPAMQLVADALDDFHYSVLASGVSYDEQGRLRLALRLEGHNPALQEGRPIHFNVNLEENIPALLTSLQLTDRVSETIKQRVQESLRRGNTSTSP